jgi:GWxTD domain-containing protein
LFRLRFLILILMAVLLPNESMHAINVKQLRPVYRHWLTEEVNYIIESQERNEFLSLKTDPERDGFIQSFWDSRNPDPSSEINTYKEEHYKRLAYANEHFGNVQRQDGWSTDRGMIWITLGEPKQQVTYPSRANVRPIIICFYQSTTPALPTFFSVMFYKRSAGEDYALYSPYQDGPNRLVTGLEAMNDQTRSLNQLAQALGSEVARTAVSLIPSEPVDLSQFSPSMMSDALLASIRGLADNPLEIARVHQNSHREKVTASIFAANDNLNVEYAVIRDEKGQNTVDYFVRMPGPDPDIAGPRKSGGPGYDLTLREQITTEAGKPVYDTVSTLDGTLQPGPLESARSKVFAAEDQFPLTPGHYVVQTTLTNNRTLAAHRLNTTVVVPGPSKTIGISAPIAYSGNPSHLDGQRLPFSFAGVRFAPTGVGTFTLHAGDALKCVFQLWLPQDKNGQVEKEPVALHFYYGSTVAGAKPMDEADETVDAANADAAGNLVTGHEFHTTGLAPGSYRVIIRATQGSAPAAYSTATLRIVPQDVVISSWSAYAPPEPQQDQRKRDLSRNAVTVK